MNKYNILSLDGGGSWSLIQARVLMDLYGDISGHELLQKFHLAIANSGGSLVLAALCCDLKLSEIIEILRNAQERKKVFSKLSFWEKLNWKNIASFTTILGPKYSTDRKKQGLIDVLKERDHSAFHKTYNTPIITAALEEIPAIIGNPQLQIIIVGFDYFKERVTFFRSNATSKTDVFSPNYYRVTLADAIHSSSNAPINYFDKPAEINIPLPNDSKLRSWYWDGAISGFNNPVLAGLVEAITNHPEIPMEDYRILSIGTGTGSKAILTEYKYSEDPHKIAVWKANENNSDYALTDTSTRFLKDVKKMSTSILGDPPDAATFIAFTFLDPTFNKNRCMVRINPCVKPEKDAQLKYGPPPCYAATANDMERFKRLMKLDMDAVEDEEVDLIYELCDKFIVADKTNCISNQLIRGDINNGRKYLGYPTYADAKKRWLEDQ